MCFKKQNIIVREYNLSLERLVYFRTACLFVRQIRIRLMWG